MDTQPVDRIEDQQSGETPEDVAILYSWANLQGAKYRDFSANRREYRAQMRHRAAEQLRLMELKAQSEAEAAAAQAEAEAAAAHAEADAATARLATSRGMTATAPEEIQAEKEVDDQRKSSLREAAQQARRAAAERLEAARRAEAAALADSIARREEREIAEAQASALRQAAQYAESDQRGKHAAGSQSEAAIPGRISDPYSPQILAEGEYFENPGTPISELAPNRFRSQREYIERSTGTELPPFHMPRGFAEAQAQEARLRPEKNSGGRAPAHWYEDETVEPGDPVHFDAAELSDPYVEERPESHGSLSMRSPDVRRPSYDDRAEFEKETNPGEPQRGSRAKADGFREPIPFAQGRQGGRQQARPRAEIVDRIAPIDSEEFLYKDDHDYRDDGAWAARGALPERRPGTHRELRHHRNAESGLGYLPPAPEEFAGEQNRRVRRGGEVAPFDDYAGPAFDLPTANASSGASFRSDGRADDRTGFRADFRTDDRAVRTAGRGDRSDALNRSDALSQPDIEDGRAMHPRTIHDRPAEIRQEQDNDRSAPQWIASNHTAHGAHPIQQNGGFSQQPERAGGQHNDIRETLQSTREQVASRWFALKELFGAAGEKRAAERQASGDIKKKTPVLAVFSMAGGVGKTSLVANLGRTLSSLGEKVLLADATSHGVLPFYFGATDPLPGVVRTFSPPNGITDVPVHLVSYKVGGGDDGIDPAELSEDLLANSQRVHRVLIDVDANCRWLVERAARLQPTVLVPLVADLNSVLSLQTMERSFAGVLDEEGEPLRPLYLLNRFDPSLPLHLDVREVLRQQLGERLLPLVIRQAAGVSESLAEGMTIVDYDSQSAAAQDYLGLANWIRARSAPESVPLRNLRWSER